MCLVIVAWQVVDDYPLIVAGNRDEFHARPTAALGWWADRPAVLAGRDLEAGGTWLGVSANGRFATVTNYRDLEPPRSGLRSRGELVTGFVDGTDTAGRFAEHIDGNRYAGFNLFASDGETLAFTSNRDSGPRLLEPGLYGLANAELDAPWHKTEISRRRFADALASGKVDAGRLLDLLDDRTLGPADDVSANGLPFARAHALTAPFIVQPDYGTRSSTVVMRSSGGELTITERRFKADGSADGETRERIQLA